MAGQGTKIAAIDYNNIQSIISLVLGTGSDQFGYGQPVASSQVSTNNKITVTQWNNLRSDLLKCRRHQTEVDESGELVDPTVNTTITEAHRQAYLNFAERIRLDANRLASPPDLQASKADLVLPRKVRTSQWNGTLTQTITVNFGSADAARFYFNSGGDFRFSVDYVKETTNPKNDSWETIFNTMGTIIFNHTETTANSGITTAYGWYDLTTSDLQIFEKATTTPTYSPNRYRILAKTDSQRTSLTFTIRWEDLYAPGGYGVDEFVRGTITSIVESRRATGTNVSVPFPGSTVSEIT